MRKLNLSEEQKQLIRDLYPTTDTYIIAEKLGLTVRQITCQANSLGVTKEGFSGKIGGWNKGLKMRPTTKAKLKKSLFQPGNKTWNTKPLFSERLGRDGWYIKVAFPREWVPKARWIWQQHNGEIPKGYKIIFADGNRNNFDIGNLQLISSANLGLKNKGLPMQDDTIIETRRIIKRLKQILEDKEDEQGH